MSGIGNLRNKTITIEIMRSSDVHFDGTESHIFFNGRIKSIKDSTDRQRLLFYQKKGQVSPMSNTDLSYLLSELEKALSKVKSS